MSEKTKVNGSGGQQAMNSDGTYGSGTPLEEKSLLKYVEEKKTPADKMASVHIDPTNDNTLPELNEHDLVKVGAGKNKPVLLKKNIIDRNINRHADVPVGEWDVIISKALYDNPEIFSGKTEGYYNFAKIVRTSERTGNPILGVVLLDVVDNKENFEIVHWHYTSTDNLEKMKK